MTLYRVGAETNVWIPGIYFAWGYPHTVGRRQNGRPHSSPGRPIITPEAGSPRRTMSSPLGLALAIAIVGILPICTPVHATEHFKDKDFACHHCGKIKVDPQLPIMLEKLRSALGNNKITITSGYRCPEHNKAIGGARRSQHLLGKAADIKVENKTPEEVGRAARKLGFGFVKVYRTWTHVDVRTKEKNQ